MTSKPSKKWPFCPATTEHGRMVPYEPATPEQAFCVEGGGRWLKCTQCTSSIIEPGRALQAQLDEQRTGAKQLTL